MPSACPHTNASSSTTTGGKLAGVSPELLIDLVLTVADDLHDRLRGSLHDPIDDKATHRDHEYPEGSPHHTRLYVKPGIGEQALDDIN